MPSLRSTRCPTQAHDVLLKYNRDKACDARHDIVNEKARRGFHIGEAPGWVLPAHPSL